MFNMIYFRQGMPNCSRYAANLHMKGSYLKQCQRLLPTRFGIVTKLSLTTSQSRQLFYEYILFNSMLLSAFLTRN